MENRNTSSKGPAVDSRLEQSVENCNLFAEFDWKRKVPLTSFEVMKSVIKNEYTHQFQNIHPSSNSLEKLSQSNGNKEMMVARSLFSSVIQSPRASVATTAAFTTTDGATSSSSKQYTPSVDALLRATFTDFHNYDKLVGYNDNTSAFLGESSSLHYFGRMTLTNMRSLPPWSESPSVENTKRCFLKLPITQYV